MNVPLSGRHYIQVNFCLGDGIPEALNAHLLRQIAHGVGSSEQFSVILAPAS